MYICHSKPVKKFDCLVTGDHIRDQMMSEIEIEIETETDAPN